MDIDTTLRESRSLNCIVRASGNETEEQEMSLCSVSVGSLIEPENSSANIIISTDNVTTIYIENSLVASSESTEQSKRENKIHVAENHVDGLQHRDLERETTPPIVGMEDIILGLTDGSPTCRSATKSRRQVPGSAKPVGSGKKNRTVRSADLNSHCRRPNSDLGSVITKPPEAPSLSKSVSHIETLRDNGGRGKFNLRTSATNGSLAAGRDHYVMDINQNTGGRKNRSEKSGALTIQGTSKCCSLS